MSSNTSMAAAGWFFGMLSWGTAIAMLVAPNWEGTSILGDSLSDMDGQGISTGLWFTCISIPSGQSICTKLSSGISGVEAHVIAARSVLIIATLAGLLGGLLILVSFKCIEIGPQEEEEQIKYARVGGILYLICGLGVLAAGIWYLIAVGQKTNTIFFSTFSRKTPPPQIGESVQITLAAGILWALSALLVLCFTSSRKREDYAWKPHKKDAQSKSSSKQEYV